MTEQMPMIWHAGVKITSKPMLKSTVLGIAIPVLLISGGLGFLIGYDANWIQGLQAFGLIGGIMFALFGFGFLVVTFVISPKGVRTAFIMDETGVRSFADDEVANTAIAAGSALGAATANLTTTATALTAEAGKVDKIAWSKVDSVVEHSRENLLMLYCGKRMVYAVYANEDNYVHVRSFIKRHVAQSKAAAKD